MTTILILGDSRGMEIERRKFLTIQGAVSYLGEIAKEDALFRYVTTATIWDDGYCHLILDYSSEQLKNCTLLETLRP